MASFRLALPPPPSNKTTAAAQARRSSRREANDNTHVTSANLQAVTVVEKVFFLLEGVG